jgi:hypothetical protein
MINGLLNRQEIDQIKDLMIAYSSFMVACHRLNHMTSKTNEAEATIILGDVADACGRVYDLQRETGIVMFTDPRALLAALTGKPVDENCRVAKTAA